MDNFFRAIQVPFLDPPGSNENPDSSSSVAPLLVPPIAIHSGHRSGPDRTPFHFKADTLPVVPENCPVSARNTVRYQSERCPLSIGTLSEQNRNHCPTRPGIRISYISEIRCDAVVEYAYEANGYAVWWWAGYPSDWSILTFPADHNDAPTPPSDPAYEFSPWAQRGAPGHSPTYNTFMTRPSVIKLPTYQVTQVTNAGYVDVTIRATDESGIHFIGCIKPHETTWTYSPTQSQHPTSASYSWTVRITNSGSLFYAALVLRLL